MLQSKIYFLVYLNGKGLIRRRNQSIFRTSFPYVNINSIQNMKIWHVISVLDDELNTLYFFLLCFPPFTDVIFIVYFYYSFIFFSIIFKHPFSNNVVTVTCYTFLFIDYNSHNL